MPENNDFEDVLFSDSSILDFIARAVGTIIGTPVAGAVASVGSPLGYWLEDGLDGLMKKEALRTWWHEILRHYDRYPCYSTFLVLPSDKDAIRYLVEYGKELDLLSGDNCLVIALGKALVRRSGFDDKAWRPTIKEQTSQGYSVELARFFNIPFTIFPCLVVFKDIRSPEHVVITLKGLSTEEIAEKMRQIFSVLQETAKKRSNPLAALESQRKNEKRHNAGETVLSELRSFAGKSFEAAAEAWIKSVFQ